MQLCYTPVLLAFASLSFAQPTDNAKLTKRQTPPPYNGALASWVSAETGIAQGRLLANISPSGGAPGSVAAATSRSNPDYFYHWVRDAGITLREVSIWLNSTSDANTAAIYNQKFQEYTAFSLKIQAAPNPYGLGLAKYNMDGTPYTGPWCNYQSDSAAARALSFIGYARRLLAKGSDISAYYDGKYPSSSVIKADLEYSKYNIVFKNGYSVGSKYAKGSATFDEILANVMVGGDMYMARVARHTDSNGQMREEWNLNTGYGSGAQDLTWSYEAHTAAARHRAAASTIVYGV
ncbi:hypothetical protein GGI12_001030 [Dipsacomyces acuminosporus]|nr:hypothetical protein GGI12_001030 [Dipsacomyces acuminosporus]